MDNFIIQANKYGWVKLAFMVTTIGENKNIFQQAEKINIVDMNVQEQFFWDCKPLKM